MIDGGVHDAQLVQLGALAGRYFRDDPGTAIFKLRQPAELLCKTIHEADERRLPSAPLSITQTIQELLNSSRTTA